MMKVTPSSVLLLVLCFKFGQATFLKERNSDYNGGHWIKVSGVDGAQFAFNNNKVNYDTAKQSCTNIGGILYEPRDQSVMKSVISLAKKANLGEFWIGIHDMDNEGTFIYDSDKSKLSFTNWNSGEPNNWGSGEDCAAVDGSGNWNDLPCADFQRSYICIKK